MPLYLCGNSSDMTIITDNKKIMINSKLKLLY